MTNQSTWIEHFPGNLLWSNAVLMTKAMAPYGGSVALAEIDEVCQRLMDKQIDHEAWQTEWCALGARLEKVADRAAAEGRGHTAGNYYLRAGMYYFTGERFIPPGPLKREIGRKALELHHAGLLRRYPNMEKVEVPFEATTLPALLLKAPGVSGPRPTIVVFDGMDNCKEMSILFCGLELSARGMNVLSIDGPGQGESLRARGIHSRYDYEVAGTAAYEYICRRPEVDPRRVAVMGYSFGGYQVPRICAFEQRYAAGVAFGAMHWDIAAWVAQIYRDNRADPKGSFSTPFQFQWVVGAKSEQEALEIAAKFSLEGIAQRVSCPFLTLHGEEDRVVRVDSAHKLHAALGTARKTLKIFTRDEGAAEHVQVDDRQRGVDYIGDWLAENM